MVLVLHSFSLKEIMTPRRKNPNIQKKKKVNIHNVPPPKLEIAVRNRIACVVALNLSK